MAEIKDQIGRIGNFQDAAIEKLSSMLNSAVGKAVKYASEQAKSSVSEKDYEKLSKALEELGDDIKESLKSTEKFVDQVKEAVKSFEKAKQSRSAGSQAKGSIESIQREQTKILGMILENQKKAQAAKIAKYTTGGSSMGSKGKLSLGDLGFKPKGADKVPAMLSPNEFIVNSKATSRNRRVLEKINQGYNLGGLVKPKYLSGAGSVGDTAAGAGGTMPIGSLEAFRRYRARADVEIDRVTLDPVAGAEAEKIGAKITEHINKGVKEGSNKEIASWLTGMSTALLGGKGDLLQTLFAGSVTDAMEFQREMRLIAFQTQGITGDFREMQGSFSDLGKVASETGKSISLMQKVYMSNLKKGFKDNKEGMKVMKSGLFLSTMIGSEAQQTADLFGDWHRTLALSSEEMSQLSRDMRSVALSTGVTGDELLGAMKSSEGILKNLRNQGNLTASVSKSVIEMMAESKKAGFEDSAQRYLSALSSHSKMMEADSSTKSLLFSVANTMGPEASQQMVRGTFMKDRSNLAGFSKGLKERVANQIGMKGENFDFSKLTQDEKDLLAMRLRGLGIEMAEAENLIKVTEQASKGLAGTLDELDRIGSSDFSTEAEKQLANKQKEGALLNHSLNYLSAISKQAKDKNLSDALKDTSASADFKDNKQDFMALGKYLTEDMKSAYGIGGTSEQMSQQLANMDPQKAAELNALVLGDQLEKAAKERGMTLDKNYSSEIKKALASGDNAKFRELVDEAQKKAGEIAVDQQASTSPEEKLALRINELNETIRAYTSSFVRSMVDYMGMMGLLLISLGLIGTALAMTVGPGLLNLTGLMKGLFPEGGFKGLISRISNFDDLASTIAKSDKVKDGMFKKFFKTYTDSRTTQYGHASKWQAERGIKGPMLKEGKGKLKSLLNASDELGNSMRSNIIGSLDDMVVKGGGFFRSIGVGTRRFFWSIKKGFLDARAANKGFFGFFKSIGKSAIKGYGSLFSSLGKSNKFTRPFTNAFIKGFSVAQRSGQGFFKSFGRGFAGMMKSTPTTKKVFKYLVGGINDIKKLSKNAFNWIRKSAPMVDAFVKGFSWARAANKGFFKSVMGGFSGMARSSDLLRSFTNFDELVKIPGKFFKFVREGFWNLFSSIRKIFSGGFVSGIKNIVKGGIGIFRGGLSGVSKAISTFGKVGMKGLKASLLAGTAGTAQIIFSAIDMVFGAVSGFTNTGKHFEGVMKAMGKSTKDMTWGMYASSTVAGALVGILDGLTFGMLSLTGATEWLNQTLSLVLYTVFSFIEGIIEGIMVPFEAVWSAFKYIGAQFKSIGDSLLGVFNSIAGLFGAEAGNWSEAFAMIYPWLKAIGKVIGMVIGMPLAGFLWLVVKAISALLVPVQMFINAIAGVIKIFRGVIDFFSDIFKGNIRKAFRNLGSVVGSAIYGVFKPILDFLWSIGADFLAPIKKLFGGIPKGMYDWIYSAAGKVGAQWLMDLLFGKKNPSIDAANSAVAAKKTAKGSAQQSATQRAAVQNPTGRNLEQAVSETYGAPTARRAVVPAGGLPTNDAATGASHSMERASASVATPVGYHAVPASRPSQGEDVGSVQPVHLRDITGSILRDKAGTSGTGRVQSDELSRIEEASFRQVEELEQIRQGISDMVALLKPKGGGIVGGTDEAGAGGTKDPRRPLHAARFGKMKYGKVGGNANRSLVNNGES